MEPLNKILQKDFPKIKPVVSVGSVMHTTYELVDNGMGTVLTDILLPAFIKYYGPGLAANMVFKDTEITAKSMTTFFLGIFIFTLFFQSPVIRHISNTLSIISRGSSLIGLKNNKHSFPSIIAHFMVSEATSALIYKLLLNKKKIKITNHRISEVSIFIIGIGFGRMYKLPDWTLMILSFGVAFIPQFQQLFSQMEFSKIKGNKSSQDKETESAVPRTPRRKAAIKANNKTK